MGYYLATKRNEVLIHASTWMNFGNIMLSELETSHKRTYIVYSTYMKCPDSQIYKTEGRFSDCLRAEGLGRNRGGMIANECGACF